MFTRNSATVKSVFLTLARRRLWKENKAKRQSKITVFLSVLMVWLGVVGASEDSCNQENIYTFRMIVTSHISIVQIVYKYHKAVAACEHVLFQRFLWGERREGLRT